MHTKNRHRGVYLQVHVLDVDGNPGDGILGDNRSLVNDGGHREIQASIALVHCQLVMRCSQVQIQIGGQHVVEQVGRGSSCEFNVQLGVTREDGTCLIKLAVVTQQTLSIPWAERTERIHGKGQQVATICVGVVRVSRG